MFEMCFLFFFVSVVLLSLPQVLHPRAGANAVPFGCRGGEPAMRRASSVPVHRGGGCKEGPHQKPLMDFVV